MEWKEQREKQRYEYKQTSKVGWTEKPIIKSIEAKRNEETMNVKIGQLDVPILKNKEKLVQLKIGHGEPSYY
jgi:hypothetical protein